ncbi:hypothetical protein QTP86_024210 [Hemibagrus guttatus]|nr:hypothetical protein QTP86_024210 [Hemibagrus guttatus]
MTSTAEPQSRMTSTAEQQDQSTSTAEQQLRATSTAEHSHRATSTDERRLRGDDVRLAEVWNSPRGGRAGAGCCQNSPPLATGAAPDAPNPSPSQKVRSSDGSWGGARNVERPVGGARSRARHLGGSEKQKQGEWGEARTKARQVGGTRIKARHVGGVRSRSETSGGSKGPDGKAKGSDATSTTERRRRTTSTAEPQSRVTSTAEQQGQATSTAELQRRAMSTAEHSHRATSTDERRLRGDDVRLAGVWNSPRGGRVGARCSWYSPPLNNRWGSAPTEATSWGDAPHRNMGGARVKATQNNKKKFKVRGPGRNSPLLASIGATPPTEATSWGDVPHRNLSRARAGNKNLKLRPLAGTLSLDKNGGTPLTEATSRPAERPDDWLIEEPSPGSETPQRLTPLAQRGLGKAPPGPLRGTRREDMIYRKASAAWHRAGGNVREVQRALADEIQSVERINPDALAIVLGDFNKGNLSHELPKYKQFIKCPTREGNVLDHCYTTISGAYRAVPHAALGQSDHIMVHLIPAYRQKLKLCKPVVRTSKKWTSEAVEELQGCLDCTDWDVFRSTTNSLDEYTDTVSSYIYFCEDNFCTRVSYNNDKPWFTAILRRLRSEKEAAFRSGDKGKYKEAKYRFSEESRAPYSVNDLQLANSLNEYYCRFERQWNSPDPHQSSPHQLFISSSSSSYTFIPVSPTQLHTLATPHPPPLTPLTIKEEEVNRLFKRLNTRKATGLDSVSPSLLKHCANQLSPVFTDIFNTSLETCHVPACSKTSTIVPVPKKTNITGLNDYRPIALTSVVMKFFERLLPQGHYRPSPGSTTVCLQSQQICRRCCEHGPPLHPSASGFPTLLRDKLFQLNVPDSMCSWITDFLTDRRQFVRLGMHVSDLQHISTGSPQGCVLSPLLFSLYTNGCTSGHQSVKLLKFADDPTLIDLISDGDKSAYRGEMDCLVSWCSMNNLELNSLKTVEMIVDFTKKAQQRMYFLWQLKKFLLPVKMLVNFYTAIIESILTSSITVWFAAATARDKAKLQRVIHSAEKVIGCSLPSLQELYVSRSWRRAAKITADPSHPGNELFRSLPSGKRLWSIRTRTSRHKNSFFPTADIFCSTSAEAYAHKLTKQVFKDVLNKYVIAYIDDILIYSTYFEDHLHHVCTMLTHLLTNHLYVKPEKCEFHHSSIMFLGYVISQGGVEMDQAKVQTVTDWPEPAIIKELQRCHSKLDQTSSKLDNLGTPIQQPHNQGIAIQKDVFGTSTCRKLNSSSCTDKASVHDELFSLRQANRAIHDYILHFCTLAASSGWNEAQHISQHLFAVSIEEGTPSDTSSSCSSPAPEPMQTDQYRLLANKRQRRLHQRLCLYCGENDHLLQTCPAHPPRPTVSTIHISSTIAPSCYHDAVLIHASRSFISSHLLSACKVPRQRNSTRCRITTIQGKPLGKGLVQWKMPELTLWIGCLHEETLSLLVLKESAVDIVLGRPWLAKHQSNIRWISGSIDQWSDYCVQHRLQSLPMRPPETALLGSTTIESLVSSTQANLAGEYQDYQDVFSQMAATKLLPH